LAAYLKKVPAVIDREFQLNLTPQLKRWEWIKLFDKYPEFRNPTKWEEIYPSPPHSS
jgi:hypothetical protein